MKRLLLFMVCAGFGFQSSAMTTINALRNRACDFGQVFQGMRHYITNNMQGLRDAWAEIQLRDRGLIEQGFINSMEPVRRVINPVVEGAQEAAQVGSHIITEQVAPFVRETAPVVRDVTFAGLHYAVTQPTRAAQVAYNQVQDVINNARQLDHAVRQNINRAISPVRWVQGHPKTVIAGGLIVLGLGVYALKKVVDCYKDIKEIKKHQQTRSERETALLDLMQRLEQQLKHQASEKQVAY